MKGNTHKCTTRSSFIYIPNFHLKIRKQFCRCRGLLLIQFLLDQQNFSLHINIVNACDSRRLNRSNLNGWKRHITTKNQLMSGLNLKSPNRKFLGNGGVKGGIECGIVHRVSCRWHMQHAMSSTFFLFLLATVCFVLTLIEISLSPFRSLKKIVKNIYISLVLFIVF